MKKIVIQSMWTDEIIIHLARSVKSFFLNYFRAKREAVFVNYLREPPGEQPYSYSGHSYT